LARSHTNRSEDILHRIWNVSLLSILSSQKMIPLLTLTENRTRKDLTEAVIIQDDGKNSLRHISCPCSELLVHDLMLSYATP